MSDLNNSVGLWVVGATVSYDRGPACRVSLVSFSKPTTAKQYFYAVTRVCDSIFESYYTHPDYFESDSFRRYKLK
jgi:hypothetical protein